MLDSYHCVMALFTYFKLEESLPDPQSLSNETVTFMSIKDVHKEVKAELIEKFRFCVMWPNPLTQGRSISTYTMRNNVLHRSGYCHTRLVWISNIKAIKTFLVYFQSDR